MHCLDFRVCSVGPIINWQQPHAAQNIVSISQHPFAGMVIRVVILLRIECEWESCVLFLTVLCKKKECVSLLLLLPNPFTLLVSGLWPW